MVLAGKLAADATFEWVSKSGIRKNGMEEMLWVTKNTISKDFTAVKIANLVNNI